MVLLSRQIAKQNISGRTMLPEFEFHYGRLVKVSFLDIIDLGRPPHLEAPLKMPENYCTVLSRLVNIIGLIKLFGSRDKGVGRLDLFNS